MNSVKGEEGDFEVDVTLFPRYIDMEKCIACGVCAEKCPKKVPSEHDMGLRQRKAAYVKYDQAVPLKYRIDQENCIYLLKGKCKACEKFCPTGAVNFDDEKKKLSLRVGSIIIAQGCETYDPEINDTYGYKRYPNIITSLEFERILSASGPYSGHLVKISDKKAPRKIAWLQCVGSRDEHIKGRGYCSSVCCTYAIKEAMLAKEHIKDLDTAIFYIDIRTFGKGFEHYYNRAKDMGVRFIKARIIGLPPVKSTGGHLVVYIDNAGKKVEEEFDMVVLSVGLGISEQGKALAKRIGFDVNKYGFAVSSSFEPVLSSRPGIYICGSFNSPKDIPSSVIDSSAAACMAGGKLSHLRWSLTKTKPFILERDIRGEPLRIGVFVCCCGTNIAGIIDVPAVVEYAGKLPGVIYAEQNLFSCSQDSLDKIAETIKEKRLNRVVVSACTPRTHGPLFQETLINAGLNKYLLEMANIRNQCSWVHKDDPDFATRKAKDLVRMAVGKAALLDPLPEPTLKIKQSALVIGGGIAGMEAARSLAGQEYKTYLLEKENFLGGQAWHIDETWKRENVQAYLSGLIDAVRENEFIEVYLNSKITNVKGFVGNFETTILQGNETKTLEHGVTIIASGASELKPDLYYYGKDKRVMTGLELQQRFIDHDPGIRDMKTAVFVQCVGSRIPERPYCSKVCCVESIKSSLKLKEINPEMNVFVIHRDIRSFGLREDLYREARSRGISFIRYDHNYDLTVIKADDCLTIEFQDMALGRKIGIKTNSLILATAIIGETENPLAHLYKVSLNDFGFFEEAHVKLKPVDFVTEGVFVCGLAHAPKPIDESITQAQAAAGRAITLLSSKEISVSGDVAEVIPAFCSSCSVCVSLCPYSAPRFDEKSGKAFIEPTLCKGCGLCVASCRSGAIKMKGFDAAQIITMIDKAMH